MKQNLLRCYRYKGKPVRANVIIKIVSGECHKPAGRSGEAGRERKTITDYYEEKRRDQKERARVLEGKWDLMKTCVT